MPKEPIWHLALSVGTSALTNPSLGKRLGKSKQAELQQRITYYLGTSLDKRVAENRDLFGAVTQENAAYWDLPKQVDIKQTSAELVSSVPIVNKLQPKDVLLIASDTDPGEFAAEVNARVFKQLYPALPVKVHRLGGLDVKLEFQGILRRFDDLLRGIWPYQSDNIAFNLTGGYKGTVLYLLPLALKHGWRVYYRHEDLEETLELDLTEAKDFLDSL